MKLSDPASQPYSLYLHIPFCTVRCTYCAFNVVTHREQHIPAYVAALCGELRSLGGHNIGLHTLYFGGGTPSLLSPPQLAAILNACRESFDVSADAEITLEANPESVDYTYLAAVCELGINRLSIGMQSANPAELKLFARQHSAETVAQTVQSARQAGHRNISLDLIYGVPTQTLDSWRQTVQAALSLEPDHLSLYALQLENRTALTYWVEHGKLPPPDDDLAADLYEAADELISAAGLDQYEISAWARPGSECRHNLQYWQNGPYLGLGAGAHGYAEGQRYQVVRSLRAYLEGANQAASSRPFPLTNTVECAEPISREQAMDETMITGLRLLKTGIERAAFLERFGVPVEVAYADAFRKLAPYDVLDISAERIRLKKKARLISNQVLLHFIR